MMPSAPQRVPRPSRRCAQAGGRWWIRLGVLLVWAACRAHAAPPAPAAAAADPRPPAELTLVTWNIANYLALGRRVDGAYRPDYPKPEREKTALRGALRSIGADIVALQEMGPPPYLAELQRDLRAEGLDYPHVAHVPAVDEDRHVAVLARVPFQTVAAHRAIPFKQGDVRGEVRRGLLEVRFATAGGELTVFVLHLKSRLSDDAADPASAQQRAGEAVAIRDLVLTTFPDPAAPTAQFIILGDCNDGPDSRPLRALQRRGGTLITRPLPAADLRGDVWTHAYLRLGLYERVDYALASPALVPAVVDGAAQVWDDEHVRVASDHRPVVVRLRWPAL